MRYIYGPVNSRRLGLSLGITLTPYKICSFDCIYCQLGKTSKITAERKEYLPFEEILEELRVWLQNNISEADKLNYITISGSGEPTLNTKIGELIGEIRKISSVPVAVITNASLLNIPLVRKELLGADLIAPSLDAVTPDKFRGIDRPYQDVKIEEVIDGLLNLRKEFKGKIWLEVMLVKGVNDDLGHVRRLKEVIDNLKPDKIQLNSPVRATTEIGICGVGKNKLVKIKEILGDRCEIV
jgi:wyosine [tRNA(Phe)-imidazoG37] synthetase (radical SAM superfamily)